jgi:hypothetical protein
MADHGNKLQIFIQFYGQFGANFPQKPPLNTLSTYSEAEHLV